MHLSTYTDLHQHRVGGTRAVVDGRDTGAALVISAAHIVVRNIEFRRGTLRLFNARTVEVEC